MVIYAEYLFLENGLAGLVVLLLTKQICGLPARWIRIGMGSVLCGLYAFTLFWTSLPQAVFIASKLFFSMGIIAFIFPCATRKRQAQSLLIFYIVSFAMGGITIGTIYFLGLSGLTGTGGFYISGINYGTVILGMAVTWSCFSVFATFLKERLWKAKVDMDVEIVIEGKSVLVRGLMDTGNFLQDPLTGKPVFLITENLMKSLLPEWKGKGVCPDPEDPLNSRYRLIPYHSVGEKNGLLAGFRPDYVVLIDQNRVRRKKTIILGVYEGSFPAGGDGKPYELLLHPAVLEGGVLDGD